MKHLPRDAPQRAKEAAAGANQRLLQERVHAEILVQSWTPHEPQRPVDRLGTRPAWKGLVSLPRAPYNLSEGCSGGSALQLDDQIKQLLRELGHAINDSVSESDRISSAIANVRAAGYDIVLKLDATIGLARRESEPVRITPQDRHFLESLHIQVDQELLEEDRKPAKLEMTPQDVKFLKSLKISLEDAL